MKNLNNIEKRWLSSVIFVALTIVFIVLGAQPFLWYLAFLILYCGVEWARIIKLGIAGVIVFSLSILSIATIMVFFDNFYVTLITLMVSLAAITVSWFYKKLYIYAGVLYFSCTLFLLWRTSVLAISVSHVWLLWLGVAVSDTSAYVIGRRFGKHALAKTVSPSKTWEGSLGGVLTTIVFFFLVDIVSGNVPSYGNTFFVVIGGVLSVVSQCGDLYISRLKRTYGVKDCGGVMPGHGGLLDRLDSFLIVLFLLNFMYFFR